MRRIKPVLMGMLLLCAATAVWATSATAPTAATATPEVQALTPVAPLTPSPQFVINLCPPEPVTSCNSCINFGVPSSYQCTIYCVNGMPRRTCNQCGQGCNP